MTPAERWARTERLYHDALARAADQRALFLAEACCGDDGLRREVESLLSHDGGAAFLSTPAVTIDLAGSMRIGQALGPYAIAAPIGQGGMGEVYRARDVNLERDVAIKILPRAFTADPERLRRFQREARLLASLNHPHIGAIYGVEEWAGGRALVLEMIEGVTLADKLADEATGGRGLAVPEALAIARQIAEALDAAHERGIVHRDLKPANIMITPSGTVKVLDFGLAKVLADHAPGDQRLSVRGPTAGDTRAGMILGTAAYMSPEQARGQAVDKRTDIWAFGCVLYEILTGRPAFAGATPSDTIAAVLTHGPDLAALPPEIALPLARLIKRCLEKDPARRQRDIGDARFELAMDDDSPIDRPGQGRLRGWRRRAAAAVGLMAIVAGSVLLGVFVRRPSPPVHATPVRFSVLPPQGSMFFHNVATTFLALSPDGSQLAFVTIAPPGPRRIWLRPISGLAAYAVPGTEGRCRSSGRLTVDRSVFSRAAN